MQSVGCEKPCSRSSTLISVKKRTSYVRRLAELLHDSRNLRHADTAVLELLQVSAYLDAGADKKSKDLDAAEAEDADV